MFPCVTEKYFPCVSEFFPVSKQNSLCFPCLEKVRTKFPVFPVFPVPWPPCYWDTESSKHLSTRSKKQCPDSIQEVGAFEENA